MAPPTTEVALEASDATRRWTNRIVAYADVAPDQLLANPLNYKIHTAFQGESLEGVLDTVGWIMPVVVNRSTGRVVDGHLRVMRALTAQEPTVPVAWVDLSEEEERMALASADAIARYAVVDPNAYAHLLSDITTDDIGDARTKKLFETIWDDHNLDSAVVGDSLFGPDARMNTPEPAAEPPAAAAPAEPADEDEEAIRDETRPPRINRSDVPDALWPTDNDWGIPMLDIAYQADAVDLPVTKWGTVRRHGARMPGTWHFYTEDYKFLAAAWGDPTPVVNSGCVSIVEPNFSTNNQMPAAVALWGVYRKRWVSRFWQSRGIRVFVDLNVEEHLDAVNLLGVPSGWRAYATRYRVQDEDHVLRCFEVAKDHAASADILFLVVGGRDAARRMAQQYGWIWCPEDAAESRGQFQPVIPQHVRRNGGSA
jgi:ParB-like chromosome segregation protein Spo0J